MFAAAHKGAAQPANDNFAERTKVTGTTAILEGSNVGATLEAGEPQPLGCSNTVWWEWTAPITGTAFFDTLGGDFPPVVGIYQGKSLSDLDVIAETYFLYYYRTSPFLSFEVAAGSNYIVCIGSPVSAPYSIKSPGQIQAALYLFPPPPNDDFALRIDLGSGDVHTNGWNCNATAEPLGIEGSDHSVWWSWHATNSGPVTVALTGMLPFPRQQDWPSYSLSVLTGDSRLQLNYIDGDNHGSVGEESAAQLTFEAEAGTAYILELAGNLGFGKLTLTVAQTRPPTVGLVKPLPDSSFYLGEPVPLSAEVFVPRGHVDHVDFYEDGYRLLGTISNWPYALVWKSDDSGQHQLTAQAVDQFGTRSVSFQVSISVRPINDDFAGRLIIPSTNYSVSVTGVLTGATYEPGEPRPSPYYGSVWWSWMAPTSGPFTIDCPDWTSMAVYTGSRVSALSAVTNISSGGRILLRAEAGLTYQIALVGYLSDVTLSISPSAPPDIVLNTPVNNSVYTNPTPVFLSAEAHDDGSVAQVDFLLNGLPVATLTNSPYEVVLQNLDIGSYVVSAKATDNDGLATWATSQFYVEVPPTARPPNDDFANRITVGDLPVLIRGTNSNATLEPGEPSLAESSVWYSWTPASSGVCTITAGPDYRATPFVAVFTGTSVSGLVTVATSSELWPGAARVVIDAVAGTAYAIDFATDSWAAGPFTLSLVPFKPPTVNITSPASNARLPSGTPVLLTADAVPDAGASIAKVDFYLDGSHVGSVSQPPYSLPINLDTSYPVAHEVQARAIDNHDVTNLSDKVFFMVTPPGPANDNFADRFSLTGSSLVTTGTLQNATLEPFEVHPGSLSVWWSWTAPASGVFTVTAVSPGTWPYSAHALAIYTGTSLTNLAPLPGSSAPVGLYTNQVTLNAQAGAVYQLAVCGFSGWDIILSIRPSAPPSLHLTSPSPGATFAPGVPVEMRAEAQDDDGPVTLDFFLDYQSSAFASLSNPPFATNITFADPHGATHALRARATDTNGLVAWDELSFSTLPAQPVNDLFARRTPLTGFLVLTNGTTWGATVEPGEQGFGSVWWSWTAPASGTVSLQSDAWPPGIRFTVYTGGGPTVADLSPVASSSGGDYPAQLVFTAAAGVAYQISATADWPYPTDFTFGLFLDLPQAAQLTTAGTISNGTFRLLLSSLAETDWVLEDSTNLVNWTPVATNSSRSHVIEFVDPAASGALQKFYRVSNPGQ